MNSLVIVLLVLLSCQPFLTAVKCPDSECICNCFKHIHWSESDNDIHFSTQEPTCSIFLSDLWKNTQANEIQIPILSEPKSTISSLYKAIRTGPVTDELMHELLVCPDTILGWATEFPICDFPNFSGRKFNFQNFFFSFTNPKRSKFRSTMISFLVSPIGNTEIIAQVFSISNPSAKEPLSFIVIGNKVQYFNSLTRESKLLTLFKTVVNALENDEKFQVMDTDEEEAWRLLSELLTGKKSNFSLSFYKSFQNENSKLVRALLSVFWSLGITFDKNDGVIQFFVRFGPNDETLMIATLESGKVNQDTGKYLFDSSVYRLDLMSDGISMVELGGNIFEEDLSPLIFSESSPLFVKRDQQVVEDSDDEVKVLLCPNPEKLFRTVALFSKIILSELDKEMIIMNVIIKNSNVGYLPGIILECYFKMKMVVFFKFNENLITFYSRDNPNISYVEASFFYADYEVNAGVTWNDSDTIPVYFKIDPNNRTSFFFPGDAREYSLVDDFKEMISKFLSKNKNQKILKNLGEEIYFKSIRELEKIRFIFGLIDISEYKLENEVKTVFIDGVLRLQEIIREDEYPNLNTNPLEVLLSIKCTCRKIQIVSIQNCETFFFLVYKNKSSIIKISREMMISSESISYLVFEKGNFSFVDKIKKGVQKKFIYLPSFSYEKISEWIIEQINEIESWYSIVSATLSPAEETLLIQKHENICEKFQFPDACILSPEFSFSVLSRYLGKELKRQFNFFPTDIFLGQKVQTLGVIDGILYQFSTSFSYFYVCTGSLNDLEALIREIPKNVVIFAKDRIINDQILNYSQSFASLLEINNIESEIISQSLLSQITSNLTKHSYAKLTDILNVLPSFQLGIIFHESSLGPLFSAIPVKNYQNLVKLIENSKNNFIFQQFYQKQKENLSICDYQDLLTSFEVLIEIYSVSAFDIVGKFNVSEIDRILCNSETKIYHLNDSYWVIHKIFERKYLCYNRSLNTFYNSNKYSKVEMSLAKKFKLSDLFKDGGNYLKNLCDDEKNLDSSMDLFVLFNSAMTAYSQYKELRNFGSMISFADDEIFFHSSPPFHYLNILTRRLQEDNELKVQISQFVSFPAIYDFSQQFSITSIQSEDWYSFYIIVEGKSKSILINFSGKTLKIYKLNEDCSYSFVDANLNVAGRCLFDWINYFISKCPFVDQIINPEWHMDMLSAVRKGEDLCELSRYHPIVEEELSKLFQQILKSSSMRLSREGLKNLAFTSHASYRELLMDFLFKNNQIINQSIIGFLLIPFHNIPLTYGIIHVIPWECEIGFEFEGKQINFLVQGSSKKIKKGSKNYKAVINFSKYNQCSYKAFYLDIERNLNEEYFILLLQSGTISTWNVSDLNENFVNFIGSNLEKAFVLESLSVLPIKIKEFFLNKFKSTKILAKSNLFKIFESLGTCISNLKMIRQNDPFSWTVIFAANSVLQATFGTTSTSPCDTFVPENVNSLQGLMEVFDNLEFYQNLFVVNFFGEPHVEILVSGMEEKRKKDLIEKLLGFTLCTNVHFKIFCALLNQIEYNGIIWQCSFIVQPNGQLIIKSVFESLPERKQMDQINLTNSLQSKVFQYLIMSRIIQSRSEIL